MPELSMRELLSTGVDAAHLYWDNCYPADPDDDMPPMCDAEWFDEKLALLTDLHEAHGLPMPDSIDVTDLEMVCLNYRSRGATVNLLELGAGLWRHAMHMPTAGSVILDFTLPRDIPRIQFRVQ